MPRKKVSELTPDELQERRKYMREAKARSRANGCKEPPYSERSDKHKNYMKNYLREKYIRTKREQENAK